MRHKNTTHILATQIILSYSRGGGGGPQPSTPAVMTGSHRHTQAAGRGVHRRGGGGSWRGPEPPLELQIFKISQGFPIFSLILPPDPPSPWQKAVHAPDRYGWLRKSAGLGSITFFNYKCNYNYYRSHFFNHKYNYNYNSLETLNYKYNYNYICQLQIQLQLLVCISTFHRMTGWYKIPKKMKLPIYCALVHTNNDTLRHHCMGWNICIRL